MHRSLLRGLALATAALAVSTFAQAQAWPTKPVRLLVAFPPGAPGDVVARLVQPALQQALGQPVIVDNKPGAGGNIGAQEVARAADGHTFLIDPDTMFTINPHLYTKLAFKPNEDLVPVSWMARFQQMLVCHPSTGFKNLDAFTTAARSKPFSYASGGPGVPGHMAMEMLLASTKLELTHVPYRGPAPAAQDVLGGAVPCGFLATPVVAPHVKEGRLLGLAVSGGQRVASAPAVPTVAEAGVPGYEAAFYETLSAPKGTPDAVVSRLQAELAKAMAAAEVRAKLAAADLEPMATTPAEALRLRNADFDKWGRVNARIRLQLD